MGLEGGKPRCPHHSQGHSGMSPVPKGQGGCRRKLLDAAFPSTSPAPASQHPGSRWALSTLLSSPGGTQDPASPHRACRASHPSPQSPEPFSFLLPRSKAVRRSKRPRVAERCPHLLGAGTGFTWGCKGHNRTVAEGKTLRQSISAGRLQVNSSRAPFSSMAAESVGKCSAPSSLRPSVPP